MAELMGRNEYARHRGCAPNAVSKAISSGRIKAAVVYKDGKFEGIDPVAADRLWAQNTDPVEAARNGKFYELPPAVAGDAGSSAGIPPREPGDRAAADTGQSPGAGDAGAGPATAQAPRIPTPSPEGAGPASAAAHGADPDGELEFGDSGSTPPAEQSDNDSYLKWRARKEEFAAKNAETEYLKNTGQLVDAEAVREEHAEAWRQVKTSLFRIPDRIAQALAAETDPARTRRIVYDAILGVCDERSRQFADDAAGGLEEPAAACS